MESPTQSSTETFAQDPEPKIAALPVPIPIPMASASSEPSEPAVSKPMYYLFLGLFLASLSYVIVALFIHHIQIRDDIEQAPTRRVQDLVSLVSQAEDKEKSLEEEVVRLRRRLIQIEGNAATGEAGGANSRQLPNYDKLLQLGGLTPVTGNGVVLTLKNPSNPMKKDKNAGSSGVQNGLQSEDILKLVNDLKAAGATAISINDQRIITTTEIVNSGPSIMVNQTRIGAPIEIRALGEPTVLANSLTIRGGILEYLQFFGISAQIVQKSKIKVPAYTGSLQSSAI